MENYDEIIFTKKAKKKLLRITFADGSVVCYKSATVTFMETLRRIGIEKLKDLDIECAHIPLISETLYPKFKDYQKPLVRGWYVMTQSDTEQKYLQLLSIKNKLNLDYTVECGDDFEASTTKLFQKSKKSTESLLVKFPDGEFIGGEHPKDTFIDAIRKIGVDDLARKGIEIAGKPLFTTSQVYKGQIEMDKNKWLMMPSTTKDKAKAIKVIGAIMRINLDVTLI